MIDKELVAIMACPACHRDVREQDGQIVCLDCGRRYPVRDGIPVMLVEEAQMVNSKGVI